MPTLEQDLYITFASASIDSKTAQGKTIREDMDREAQRAADKNLKALAQGISTSIVDFLLKQTFTITEMKAATELESFGTKGAGAIQIMPGIATAMGGPTVAPGNSQPINLSKGQMTTFGHSYIGKPSQRIKDTDTADEWNSYTKVRLDPYKLKDQGRQIYPLDERPPKIEEELVILLGPIAKFMVSGINGTTAIFNDISVSLDGAINSALNEWDFGDDNIVQGPSPLQYTYAAADTYTVSLTVTDTNGLSNTYSDDIVIPGFLDPVAVFTWEISALTVSFADISSGIDGAIVSWEWNFGDGGSDSTPNPVHTYTDEGTYSVSLTVTDVNELSNTKIESITVPEPEE